MNLREFREQGFKMNGSDTIVNVEGYTYYIGKTRGGRYLYTYVSKKTITRATPRIIIDEITKDVLMKKGWTIADYRQMYF